VRHRKRGGVTYRNLIVSDVVKKRTFDREGIAIQGTSPFVRFSELPAADEWKTKATIEGRRPGYH